MTSYLSPTVAALYESPGPRARRRAARLSALGTAVLLALAAVIVWRFYEQGQLDARYWYFFVQPTTWAFIWEGLAGTVEVSLAAGALALLLGTAYVSMRVSRFLPARILGTALTEFTRSVPALLFIYLFFLAVPQTGLILPAFWNITLPVAISASGVVSELLRSGIYSVPRGQVEAALSLGMAPRRVMARIVYPQAFRMVVPSLIAELVIVVKNTTFAYIVNYPDLMQNAVVLLNNYDSLLSVYLVVAVIYVLVNFMLNQLSVLCASFLGGGYGALRLNTSGRA